MYYISYRIINGNAKWIIIDENYKIILNPSDDQIKTSILGNPPKKCCKCGSLDRKNVKRVCVVPDKELYGITGINIYKHSSKGIPLYEKYRIDDEPYNGAYHNLMEYLKNKILHVGNKKFFDVKDVKEWLKK